MNSLYIFLIRNDVWIYILCALGLFWYTSELWRARNILRRAVFGLERENGTRMRNNALFFIALFVAIALLVYYVNSRVAPTLPPELLQPPAPEPDIFATPLSSPTPLGTPEESPLTVTPELAPTVTLALPGQSAGEVPEAEEGAPTITPTVYVPPTPFIACTPELNITDPRNGGVLSGEITFFGTAGTENFEYFTLETNGPQTNGQWASLLGRNVTQPVQEGFLGSADLSGWQAGPYLIRLTATDFGGNITGQCVIQVTLSSTS